MLTLIGSFLLLTAFLSTLLLHHPHLLHPSRNKKLLHRRPAVRIAHRGSRQEGLPENSLAAFKDAVLQGADVVELDVWLLADNQTVIVHHDATLSRMSGGANHERISSLTYAELPLLSPKDPNQTFAIANRSYSSSDCRKIPTFEEALLAIPESVSIIIEFKQDSDILIENVLSIVKKHHRLPQIYWFSLTETINRKLRRWPGGESIPVIVSLPGLLRTVFLYYMGLLPFFALRFDVFGITMEEINLERIRKEPALKAVPDNLKRIMAYFFNGKPSRALLSPPLFRHLKKRGVPIWFLGVNDDHDLKTAELSGATGLLTDRITWLSKQKFEPKW